MADTPRIPHLAWATLRKQPMWIQLAGLILVLALFAYGGLFWFLRNPASMTMAEAGGLHAEAERLETHVGFLTSIQPSRSMNNPAALTLAADYVKEEFAKTGCAVREHTFTIQETVYRNIICASGPEDAPRVVIGAHYDVAGDNNPGADDNASGVAGVLEIARLLGAQKPPLDHRVELVAFTLEEVLSSRGSLEYARFLREDEVDVDIMVSVEMIGYFSDEAGSQTFPLSFLNLFYPREGNFIGVVGRAFDRSVVSRVKKLMTVSDKLPVYSINAPKFIPAIELSDHKNFWAAGYPAVMVTDTAFLRNPNYHRSTDAADTLDYERMAAVVDGLYRVTVDY